MPSDKVVEPSEHSEAAKTVSFKNLKKRGKVGGWLTYRVRRRHLKYVRKTQSVITSLSQSVGFQITSET